MSGKENLPFNIATGREELFLTQFWFVIEHITKNLVVERRKYITMGVWRRMKTNSLCRVPEGIEGHFCCTDHSCVL